jgi:hypothetical protein
VPFLPFVKGKNGVFYQQEPAVPLQAELVGCLVDVAGIEVNQNPQVHIADLINRVPTHTPIVTRYIHQGKLNPQISRIAISSVINPTSFLFFNQFLKAHLCWE